MAGFSCGVRVARLPGGWPGTRGAGRGLTAISKGCHGGVPLAGPLFPLPAAAPDAEADPRARDAFLGAMHGARRLDDARGLMRVVNLRPKVG